MVQRALVECRSHVGPLKFVSVAVGPGSFTGIRVGVATAKALSYALKLPVVGVDSLAAIAASVLTQIPSVSTVGVALNAYRGQAFIGAFQREFLCLNTVSPLPNWSPNPERTAIVDTEGLQRFLVETTENPNLIAGDVKLLEKWVPGDALYDRTACYDKSIPTVDAVGVGRLGWRGFIAQRWMEPVQLVPKYLRLSAAEEKL
jgi:tRNA threonylcarbamoyl adenosine modification protein YeaZ